MVFLFDFITISCGLNRYSVFEVDTGVYFCSPQTKTGEWWMNNYPEFYISKVNRKWQYFNPDQRGNYVLHWLIEDAGEAIDKYLFDKKINNFK